MQLINTELERERTTRRFGPMAENVIRDAMGRTNTNPVVQGARPPAGKVDIARVAVPSTRADAINVLPEGNN